MTSRTHREFSLLFSSLALMFIYDKCISEINFYLVYAIMRCIGTQGALFPDVDHIWKNVKEKTIINWIINKLIHLTGGKHRSWQTHSLEICLISGGILLYVISYNAKIGNISDVNFQVSLIVILGFYCGWLSHLFSDALTTGGIYIFGKKVKLVPKKIGKLKFNTGNEWEAWVYQVMIKTNNVMTLVSLAYPILRSVYFSSNVYPVIRGLADSIMRLVSYSING